MLAPLSLPALKAELRDKVVIKFGASWCAPCQLLQPVFEELAYSDNFRNVKFLTVDIDDLPDAALHFDIQSVPTTIIMRGSSEIARKEGYMSKEKLNAFIQSGI